MFSLDYEGFLVKNLDSNILFLKNTKIYLVAKYFQIYSVQCSGQSGYDQKEISHQHVDGKDLYQV